MMDEDFEMEEIDEVDDDAADEESLNRRITGLGRSSLWAIPCVPASASMDCPHRHSLHGIGGIGCQVHTMKGRRDVGFLVRKGTRSRDLQSNLLIRAKSAGGGG